MKVINNFKYIIGFLFLICLFSCKKQVLDYKEYMKFLANKESGLVKEIATGGIKLKVKYLPLDYLVYNQVKSSDSLASKEERENIKKTYENSLTFMLTLGPDTNESFSITRVGVTNYQEFAERIETMSFNMSEYISLKIKDKEYKPDLTQMESINSLEQSKNIIVVFKAIDEVGKKITTDDLVFIYNDELFLTGINKFKFKKNDILDLPELKY